MTNSLLRQRSPLYSLVILATLGSASVTLAGDKSFRVPYQLTETQHILVRVKINGDGPLNFIIDTGAPLVFVGTEAAKRIGFKGDKNGWGQIDKLEVEGGAIINDIKVRVEDPFQLTGMNRMNLPGVRLDGILGYNALARFAITYDFTASHLTWKDLNWKPPFPQRLGGGDRGQTTEMDAMASLVKFATALVGKRPSPVVVARGFWGVEVAQDERNVNVTNTLPGGPADAAGILSGDQIISVKGKRIRKVEDLFTRAAQLPAGEAFELKIKRNGESKSITLTPSESL